MGWGEIGNEGLKATVIVLQTEVHVHQLWDVNLGTCFTKSSYCSFSKWNKKVLIPENQSLREKKKLKEQWRKKIMLKIVSPSWSTCYVLFYVFCLFRATPVAYGGSQARVHIGVVQRAYITATETPDPSCICDLHHSSCQRWILNPLSEARDQTCALMDTSRVH